MVYYISFVLFVLSFVGLTRYVVVIGPERRACGILQIKMVKLEAVALVGLGTRHVSTLFVDRELLSLKPIGKLGV